MLKMWRRMYNFKKAVNIINVILGGVRVGRTSNRKFNGYSNELVT